MQPTIALLGTGRMGSALCRALVEAGHPTTAWNRTRSRLEPLRSLGAGIADSAAEAIAAADIVIVNVTDYTASAATLRAPDAAGALRGKLIVELTSGAPHEAREAAGWAEAQGAAYLDGAIMATPNFIGTDGGTILLAGSTALFDANIELLRALGGNAQHVGDDPGAANALDSALLGQMWGALFGTLHAIALCEAEQVDLADFARQRLAFAPVVEGAVVDLIERTKARRFASDEQTLASIAVHHSTFGHLLHASKAHKLDGAMVEAFDGIFSRAIAAGHLNDDFAALTQFMRSAS